LFFPAWRNYTLRIADFLVIIALVVLWYGLVPIGGALISRYKWWQFRRRFDELRLRPLLDYRAYRRLSGEGGVFRFIGGFESVTDGRTLWIQGENLTIPVSLANARSWLLPMQEGSAFSRDAASPSGKGEGIPESFDPGEEAPERIRWDRLSTITEGARVFVGGALAFQDERWCFVSTRETPLQVIFYDCPDAALTARTIRAGRNRNEYWNAVTPYSLVIGALCQIFMALSFLPRPAFRLTVITALIALFIPLYPLIPPGLLFTVLYRRLAWYARILRSYRDLARLPLRCLAPGQSELPDGESYGCVICDSLPAEAGEGKIPFLLPEYSGRGSNARWHIFGALRPGQSVPSRPADPSATFGILPGNPESLARRYAIFAYALEAAAWLALLAGIGLNIFFIRMIIILL
jgi:hypothetical protein